MQTTGRDLSNAKYSVFESITSARPTRFTHEAPRRRMQHDTDRQHLIVVTVHVTSTPMCISVAWKRSYDHSNVPLWECLRWRPDIRSTGHFIQHGTLFPMSKVKVVSRGYRLSRHCSATLRTALNHGKIVWIPVKSEFESLYFHIVSSWNDINRQLAFFCCTTTNAHTPK